MMQYSHVESIQLLEIFLSPIPRKIYGIFTNITFITFWQSEAEIEKHSRGIPTICPKKLTVVSNALI